MIEVRIDIEVNGITSTLCTSIKYPYFPIEGGLNFQGFGLTLHKPEFPLYMKELWIFKERCHIENYVHNLQRCLNVWYSENILYNFLYPRTFNEQKQNMSMMVFRHYL